MQIEILQRTIEIYEEERRSLVDELEGSELRLQRELTDKRHMEQRLKSVVADTELKWEKECVSYYQRLKETLFRLDLQPCFFSPIAKMLFFSCRKKGSTLPL